MSYTYTNEIRLRNKRRKAERHEKRMARRQAKCAYQYNQNKGRQTAKERHREIYKLNKALAEGTSQSCTELGEPIFIYF